MALWEGKVEAPSTTSVYHVMSHWGSRDWYVEVFVDDWTHVPVTGPLCLDDARTLRRALEKEHTPVCCEYCGYTPEECGQECACQEE